MCVLIFISNFVDSHLTAMSAITIWVAVALGSEIQLRTGIMKQCYDKNQLIRNHKEKQNILMCQVDGVNSPANIKSIFYAI